MIDRFVRAVLLLVGVTGLCLTAGVRTAGAHGTKADMKITKAEANGRTVTIEVGLTFANDSDLVTGATVTATLTGPAGATAGPVTLTAANAESARYTGTVTVPADGAWKIAIVSKDPAASAEATVAVGAGAGTTTGSAPPSSAVAPTTAGPATSAPAPTAGPTTTVPSPPPPADPASGTSLLPLLIVGAVIALAVVAGLAWRARHEVHGSDG